MDLRSLPAYRPDAPGAVLDDQPWAKSWAAYLRAVFGPDNGPVRRFIANAWSEEIPSEGGFLVPESLRAQVMTYMTSAIMRPLAMVIPMGTYRLGLPLLDNPSQASGKQALGGLTFSLVEAGETIPASNPAFGRLVLEARKIAAYLQNVPNELADDAAGAMGDLLARVIAMGLAWYEDDLFVANGTGVNQPQSLANAPCAVTVTRGASDTVALPDITSMIQSLHPAALQAGMTAGRTDVRWLVSADAFNQLLELYFNPSGGSAAGIAAPSPWLSLGDGYDTGPSLLGLPCTPTDHQPALGSAADVILADLSQYVVADRLALTVERSAAGPGFSVDASDFRVRSRLDGRYWVQSSTTTEAGQVVAPVVILE